MSWSFRLLLAPVVLAAIPAPGTAQTARISEEVRTLSTYPFSEPNPIPILTRDERLYPYHSFEGYSATAEPREWNVVRLENDYIEVFVLPEVGGKVWGAIVKQNGHEFIYRNEVMKFRNIALRGPWTSGGIEFNFGVIGHTPATATPVDYLLRENSDGSVSCWVGSMDLPSRTHWRVEIRLPPDRAWFETNVLWYNPTPLEQPYYNWMTAAAFARDDLEMSIPGNAYLKHSGAEMTWPEDEDGRFLPLYRNNTFAGHKSYHVVGELNDFFGGYYRNDDYGFGHWSRHEEMPGQKLWLWALSREGGVWEDLLTDTDGQYVEYQAGRLFVQYSPGSDVNPITQAGFDPLSASRWTETWFPVEGTGGLTEASRDGAMHLLAEDSRLTISVSAFGDVSDTIKVWSGGEVTAGNGESSTPVAAIPVTLSALQPFRTTVEITAGVPYRVALPALGLEYDSDPSERLLSRPFNTDPEAWAAISEADRLVFEARELLKGRRYGPARELFESALDQEPWNRDALLGMADLSYRSALYEAGLENVNRALQLDAYDAEANFQAGTLYRALHQFADARDAFGWAARSMAWRSAAYVQLAELMIGSGNWPEAARYARLALDFDRTSVSAWRALAVIGRKVGDEALADGAIRDLLNLDPLHHFARAEQFLSAGGAPAGADAGVFLTTLGGEFPDQSLLELAIGYASLGLPDDARAILALRPANEPGPVHLAWQAALADDPALLAGDHDPAFAFPYRPETLPVLEWAAQNSDVWLWTWLLGLNLWALDRDEEAATQLDALGDEPDFGPAYVARAHLLSQLRGTDPEPDLRRAVALSPDDRTIHIQLIRYLQEAGQWDSALTASSDARKRFPGDFNLELLEARALIHLGRPQNAALILAASQVLPSENARDSHRMWEQAHTLAALDTMQAGDYAAARVNLAAALEWPESLGQGRPYEPEERLVRFLLGVTEEARGNEEAARDAFRAVVDATGELDRPLTRLDLLVVPALEALGRTAEAEELIGTRGPELDALYAELDTDLDGRMILSALQQIG
ncbi:MAG: DUF5107 domain-containing protein [Gemmatimonadetes bacterium]|nr:DUF5107 domain-containing protein [Gemmatimonadota bacterium]